MKLEYSDEFVKTITEDFILKVVHPDHAESVRVEAARLREKKHDALFLELDLARTKVYLEKAKVDIRTLVKMIEVLDLLEEKHSELVNMAFDEELRLNKLIINYWERKPKVVAKAGGDGRAEKFKALEIETIKLYQEGSWATVPLAAQEITPKIVAMSERALAPTTNKPLEWIRAYRKSLKSTSC